MGREICRVAQAHKLPSDVLVRDDAHTGKRSVRRWHDTSSRVAILSILSRPARTRFVALRSIARSGVWCCKSLQVRVVNVVTLGRWQRVRVCECLLVGRVWRASCVAAHTTLRRDGRERCSDRHLWWYEKRKLLKEAHC